MPEIIFMMECKIAQYDVPYPRGFTKPKPVSCREVVWFLCFLASEHLALCLRYQKKRQAGH